MQAGRRPNEQPGAMAGPATVQLPEDFFSDDAITRGAAPTARRKQKKQKKGEGSSAGAGDGVDAAVADRLADAPVRTTVVRRAAKRPKEGREGFDGDDGSAMEKDWQEFEAFAHEIGADLGPASSDVAGGAGTKGLGSADAERRFEQAAYEKRLAAMYMQRAGTRTRGDEGGAAGGAAGTVDAADTADAEDAEDAEDAPFESTAATALDLLQLMRRRRKAKKKRRREESEAGPLEGEPGVHGGLAGT